MGELFCGCLSQGPLKWSLSIVRDEPVAGVREKMAGAYR